MFLKLLILSIIFLALAAIGFGIRMLVKKQGQFPETHVSRNPAMRARGITCAQQTDTGCHSSDGFPGCSCSGSGLWPSADEAAYGQRSRMTKQD